MTENFNTLAEDQFDANGNLNEGSRKGPEGSRAGETLVDFTKRIKGGRENFVGPGDVDITFSEAYPSSDYQIVFGQTTVAATPIYTNQVATGFRITVAAAGVVDWMTFYNGPTS
jgi:hypothetical protein